MRLRAGNVLLAFLLLVPPAWAKEPEVYPTQGVQTFLGLDDSSAPTQVQDGRATDLQNVLLSDSRDLRKRFGVDQIGDVLDVGGVDECAITGIYYTKFSSTTERILATCGSFVYYLNGTDWERVSGPTLTGGQDNQFVFTTALDNVIGTNNVDKPIQYDGTSVVNVSFGGLSAASTPSKAKTVAFFKNYLIFANTTENSVSRSTRFRWSNVGTINTWSDDDYVDIGALGGQEINAMAELYDNLYVFLTDSIYRISLVGGADTFQVSKVTDDIGCIAKNSVQSVTLSNAQNGLIFLDKDKAVYFFNGVIAQDISGRISTTMEGLSGTRLQYAVSTDTTTDYWLCVTNSTASRNNLCLDLQYEIAEWTKHTNIFANAMARVLDSNVTDQTYYGDDNSLIYQLENEDLRDDIDSTTGTISSVDRYASTTESSLFVIYVSSAAYTTGALVGAPIEIVGGTGIGSTSTVYHNTTTGIVVIDDFSTAPVAGDTFEVGVIDAFYTTKWYDLGNAARLKHFGKVYFWAEADVSSTHSLAYATDYGSDIQTLSVSLSSSETDAIWGSAIWGTSIWGDVDDVFREPEITGEGRYVRLKWSEDDPDESFHIYGYNFLSQAGQVSY